MSKPTVRTRFAPSPTGYLHIGGLRTALYNFIFARQNKGQFILRIEDTDKERFVPDAVDLILKTLSKFEIDYDEGPDKAGEYGPYTQSERLLIYQTHIAELIKTKKAYYCFCTSERLEAMRLKQKQNSEPTKYDGHCRNLSEQEISQNLKNKVPFVIRLKVEPGETSFTDLIRGKITFDHQSIDDQILIKSDGYPTYHFANVVDDHLMHITHVIRGEEWVSSTPKHILLYQAFNWPLPFFAHLPLLLNSDKSKLSKRQGDVSADDYLKKGYLPDAILNFIALLGWNPGSDKEFFTLTDLISEFDLEKVQKSGAVFNLTKLKWFNAHYIAQTPTASLLPDFENIINQEKFYTKNIFSLEKIIELFKTRVNSLLELSQKSSFLYSLPNYEVNLLSFKKTDLKKVFEILNFFFEVIDKYDNEWQADKLKTHIDLNREVKGYSRSESFWPLRVAITGLESSPDVFATMEILGKKESQLRIKQAIEKIEKM